MININSIGRIKKKISNFIKKRSKLFICLLILIFFVISVLYVYSELKDTYPNDTNLSLIGNAFIICFMSFGIITAITFPFFYIACTFSKFNIDVHNLYSPNARLSCPKA